jgi:hypothetical protein
VGNLKFLIKPKEMTKFTAFVIVIALRIGYHPFNTQNNIAPFASPSLRSASTTSVAPAKLISISGSISNDKVILNWVVGANETADKFEVEKSTDGKTFIMAALVFGTDKTENDNYMFYEKAGKQKVLYRIKLINKNQQAAYSDVVEINPGV